MKYVDVVIDNKNDNTDTLYTYGCPIENVETGSKVYVPFNRGNKIKEAYVFSVRDDLEKEIANLKTVEEIDEDVYLTEEAVTTVKWMRKRYFCRYIDAVKLFLPVGSKAKRREIKEPVDEFEGERQDIERLTFEQEAAMAQIIASMEKGGDRFLLQGATGSGKTEIYMRSASECIKNGKTVVVIVPEVSLTGQLIERFIARFGRKNIAIMHSRLTAGERYDQWQKIKNGDIKIVIGARSAVFAPVKNIGLIVLDEEHEASYKSDMSPKYDTAEVAAKRAEYYGGCVIMGSATPSVSSMKKCEDGIYKKLVLKERYNGMPLPQVFVEDMRAELKEGNRSVFSRRLYDEIKNTLAGGGQTILLINRRGYSSFVSCRQCGYVVKCEKCGIPMTYHKDRNKLVCHYCGKTAEIPDICPECGSGYIRFFGTGTEKIEAETKKLFPDAVVDRLDFDTASKKSDMNRILKNFSKGKTDILVGTQLIGKGLDNRNVDLAGILAVDTMLNLPDYRASERAFQLISQAAGRTGRGEKRGKVIVQTYQPDSFAVRCGAEQDPDKFYKNEIRIRELMGYPPFGVFGQFSITGKSDEAVNGIAKLCLNSTEKSFGKDAIVGVKKHARSKEDLRVMILIKFSRKQYDKFAQMAEELKEYMRNNRTGVALIIDTDPYTLWRN
ncbi:replication restart helicase PriA [Gallibacter intestinalis]|uniref:Replication restart protein PriA n=1 Tax=Gallibacter intestinalis TaxID=2779356 RepID=A0ABR9QVL2_9FIRM|nr:primosomal protein N' [Gallibacter intestinalis]MBE5034913.1 primosomal protein N' [Gallibacter intestinalis]